LIFGIGMKIEQDPDPDSIFETLSDIEDMMVPLMNKFMESSKKKRSKLSILIDLF